MPYFFGVVLLTLAAVGRADANPDDAALAEHPRWQALMHINQGGTLRDRGNSYVDDTDFFLADNGKTHPRAELKATRKALKQENSKQRCRFPARYRFLAEQLSWDERAPLSHCAEYRQWRRNMPTGQMVLVFPAAYLNSPSSMFGHTLLRLDDKPDPASKWLSKAINFGAQVDQGDDSFTYVWQGLAGGYPGQFSVVPYARKIREYAHLENRDMWEYALNLEPDELDWAVRHLWELRDINFDYFFFDENCSYRLLELVRVARPSAPLMEELRFAELPVKTVRALEDAGLITDRRYQPSKATQLRHLASRLKPAEKELAQRLRNNPDLAARGPFQSFAPERRHLMAQAAYQARRLQNREGQREEDKAGKSFALLRVIQRNPAPQTPAAPEPEPPENGHRTQMVRLGGGLDEDQAFGELGWRLTYHDVLDPITGFLPGAGIEGLDLRMRSTDSGPLELEQLDLVHIRSLSPRDAFVKPVSWYVHAGWERARAGRRRHPTRFLEAGPGLAWRLGGIMPYGLLRARAEHVSPWTPAIETGAGAELGLLYQKPGLQADLSARGVYFENDFRRHRFRARITLPVSQNQALRFACERNGWGGGARDECRLEWRHYYD